jgi:hypothetical protein
MRNKLTNMGSIRTFTIAATSLISSIYGHPLSAYTNKEVLEEEPPIDYGSAEFVEKMVVVMALVLLGGAFAGILQINRKKKCVYMLLTCIQY